MMAPQQLPELRTQPPQRAHTPGSLPSLRLLLRPCLNPLCPSRARHTVPLYARRCGSLPQPPRTRAGPCAARAPSGDWVWAPQAQGPRGAHSPSRPAWAYQVQ